MKKLLSPVRKIPTSREGIGLSTIPEMIEHSADIYGGNEAYKTTGYEGIYTLTYNDVLERVMKLSRHLKESGFGKGDHIAVLGENRPEWGIAFFAVSWIGAVCIPLDAKNSAADHKFILTFSSAKAIIVSGSHANAVISMTNEIPSLKKIIIMENIAELRTKYSKGIERENVEPGDLLEILFTSGTTGDPKGVMLTHANIMSNVSDIYRITGFRENDRSLSILPIHHSYECTGGLIAAFSSGMSVFYARSLKPRELLEDLKIAKPTVWLNTPLVLEKLYLRIEKQIASQRGVRGMIARRLPKKMLGRRIRKELGLSEMRLIVSGGAALPPWIAEGFQKYGLKVIQGYGLSEAAPLVSVNPPANPRHDSVGMVIPSDEVEIRDVDSEGNGEIAVRGPNIMKGYYRNEPATKETLTDDGWLLTGDIGYFDADGYLYITGRKKYVIVTPGGKNIFPEEVEEKLCKSRYIEEAMVFSPDDINIQALIYPDMNEISAITDTPEEYPQDKIWELMNSEIRDVNKGLQAYKKIRQFAVRTEEFPKTSTRKIKRYLFKDLDLSQEAKFLK